MLTVLIALGIFGTILLFLQGCAALHRMMAPRGTDRAVERVQKWSAPEATGQLNIVRKESLSDIPWLNDLLIKARRFQPLRLLHRQADCRVPLGIFVLAMPLLALGALLLALSMHQALLLALLFAVVLGALPAGYLYWLKSQRMAMFERQLPEALELVSRALRAGHAFSVGLKLVGDEAADPIGIEFRRVFDEVSMGVALPQALQNMTDRLDCVDLRFFVTSVLVQRETGGNLAEIIDSLAGMIRKRFELQLRVRALSAEGRFSAIILFGLPIVVGLLLYKMNPDYMSTLFTDPMGQNMLMVGSFLMVTGAIIMKRMVAIKV
ncbi:MAG: type II secretion system F family protein [Nitrospirae bacterium]|nr:type II secretion system F family protein [Nitrospirota bacterium]MBU6481254.1 type II secretion system F family protein [Nitrospirota bacterium]MDE3041036.1 type II secretion system F family protein [Nitrospirota bacterium]MDE3220947.1 type II secretion system F family protein [Nitrospirota bacterium]